MALESIENTKIQQINTGKIESPKKTRIISESTGLAKFNITQKIQERENSIDQFQTLEAKAQKNEDLKFNDVSIHKNGLNLKSPISPKRSSDGRYQGSSFSSSSSSSPKRENIGMINEQLMLELASKQREVLELKNQMDQLKKKLSTSEKELWEIEKKCNRTTASTLPPALSPIRSRQINPRISQSPTISQSNHTFLMEPSSLRSKPSLSTIKASIEATATQQTNNFVNLKKKISIQQLNAKPSLTSFKNFQKESNLFWEKSVNALTTFKTDFMKEVNQVQLNNGGGGGGDSNESSGDGSLSEEDEDYESDVSDYGCADTSDYQLAVK